MSKYNILITLLVTFFSGTTSIAQDTLTMYFDENWEEIQDQNHAVFFRKAIKNDMKLWEVNDYYISGKIQMTGTFKSKKMDKHHGHFIYYFENGSKQSEGYYENNKYEGKWTTWYDSGNIKDEGIYRNGKREGKWQAWHPNGEKMFEGRYLDNKQIGTWKYWYDTGEIKDKIVLRDGMITSSQGFHKNGEKKYNGTFENGMPNGEWTYWNWEGRKVLSGNFKNGFRDGEWNRYFREGEMLLFYERGQLKGPEYGGLIRRGQ